MEAAVDHIEVFFSDPKNGWVTMEYDSEGNVLDGAQYNYRKSSAIKEARAMAGGIYLIKVFGRNGEFQRNLNNAHS
jgi:hypothetical protein